MPVLNALLLLPVGAADDPADRPGLAAITGDMLDEGSGSLSALEFHEALGRLGSSLDTEVGPTPRSSAITMLERVAERGLDLLAQLVTRAAVRRGASSIASASCASIASRSCATCPRRWRTRAFVERLYPSHPYGHLSIGTEPSLAALWRRRCRAVSRHAVRPGRLRR